jgi:8-oxo-dGTP diphosphatase
MADLSVLVRSAGQGRGISRGAEGSAADSEIDLGAAVVRQTQNRRWDKINMSRELRSYSSRVAASVPGVTGRPVLPPDQYVASLARKRMAATAFFRDDQGRVLLVNPVYKATWDLPGGAVEAEESPHAACRREVAEELGLDRPPGPVLAVDWVPSRPERPEGLIVVYDGGVLSDTEIKEIVLADGELAGFAFVAGDEVAGLVTPLLARRVASCLDAVAAGTVAALENGSPAA